MKLIISLCICGLFTACSEPVRNWELKKANEFCKSKSSEIDYLIVYDARLTKVVCFSGDYTELQANRN